MRLLRDRGLPIPRPALSATSSDKYRPAARAEDRGRERRQRIAIRPHAKKRPRCRGLLLQLMLKMGAPKTGRREITSFSSERLSSSQRLSWLRSSLFDSPYSNLR
jgi:hypothetical protein